jgi:hypothetical protein
MPIFKTTHNIFVKKDSDELFDNNWVDRDTVFLPPKRDWDYKRNLTIEDVDIWEVIYEAGGGFGVYASWSPFAEFYMFTPGASLLAQGHGVETYYGADAGVKIFNRVKEFGITLTVNQVWVDDEKFIDMKAQKDKFLHII